MGSVIIFRIGFLAIVMLAFLFTPSLGGPVSGGRGKRDQPVCDNAPNVVLGTYYAPRRRSLEWNDVPRSLSPRSSSNLAHYCTPHSTTYVTLSIRTLIAGVEIAPVFSGAMGVAYGNADRLGDNAQIPVTGFNWFGRNGLAIHLQNSNNQRMTWKIVGAALDAVFLYMVENVSYGTAIFTIHDGAYEVGRGVFG